MAVLELFSRCCMGALISTSKHSLSVLNDSEDALLVQNPLFPNQEISTVILGFIDQSHPTPSACWRCPRTMLGGEAARALLRFNMFYSHAMDLPLCEICDPLLPPTSADEYFPSFSDSNEENL